MQEAIPQLCALTRMKHVPGFLLIQLAVLSYAGGVKLLPPNSPLRTYGEGRSTGMRERNAAIIPATLGVSQNIFAATAILLLLTVLWLFPGWHIAEYIAHHI